MLNKPLWSSSANLPSIPRWGLEPYEDEPAHGFFLRLAALNGQQSIPAYAMSLGLNGRNIDPQQMLQFCEQLPIAGIERLRKATPRIVKQSAYLRGEHLRMGRDWSIRRGRYCPECVREESYHRFWFDLAVVRVCPTHRLALISRPGGMKLAWEDPSPLAPLESVGQNSPDENSVGAKWSEYVLGRLGAWPVSSQPLLDVMPLLDVVYLCNAIGAMSKYGWKHRPGHGRCASTGATAEGFHYVANGGSLEALCDGYLRQAPSYEKGEFSCKDMQLNLGWLYTAITSKQYSSATMRLRQAIDDSLVRNRACRPLKKKVLDTGAVDHLCGLSAQMGLYPSEIRQLARWLSIDGSTDGQFRAAQVDIPNIDLLARNLVPSEAAAQALGVPLERFPGVQIHLGIKRVLRAQAGRPARYDIRQIERLVDDLRGSVTETDGDVTLGNLDQYRVKARCSFATAAYRAVGGALPVHGWLSSEAGIMGALVPIPASTSRPYQTRRRTAAE
ncbi:TniQ family protein [Mesorhizobium sp.]|uniref:TniQ family protein n=1 Tax=Mesorhizobium sp. TaxID=1871066 RepID=UPI00338DBB91